MEKTKKPKKIGFTNRMFRLATIGAMVFETLAIALGAYAVYSDYTGSMAWLTAIIVAPWTFLGIAVPFVVNKSKAENMQGGIAFETAKAQGFTETDESPRI